MLSFSKVLGFTIEEKYMRMWLPKGTIESFNEEEQKEYDEDMERSCKDEFASALDTPLTRKLIELQRIEFQNRQYK